MVDVDHTVHTSRAQSFPIEIQGRNLARVLKIPVQNVPSGHVYHTHLAATEHIEELVSLSDNAWG